MSNARKSRLAGAMQKKAMIADGTPEAGDEAQQGTEESTTPVAGPNLTLAPPPAPDPEEPVEEPAPEEEPDEAALLDPLPEEIAVSPEPEIAPLTVETAGETSEEEAVAVGDGEPSEPEAPTTPAPPARKAPARKAAAKSPGAPVQTARVRAGTGQVVIGEDLVHLRRVMDNGRDQRRYVEDLPRRSEKGTYLRLPKHLQDALAEYCDRNVAPMADFIAAVLDGYFRDIGLLPPMGQGHHPDEDFLDRLRKESRTYDY